MTKRAKPATLSDHLPHYLKAAKAALRPKTFAEYIRLLDRLVVPEFGTARLTDITTRRVDRWHAAVAEKTPAQANRALAVLSAVLRHAARWGALPVNPVQGVAWAKERARDRYLTPEERQRLVDAVAALPPLERAFVVTALHTGARPGELVAARWEDVKGEEIVLAEGKNGDRRVIYVPPQVFAELMELPTDFGPIFAGVNPELTWRRVRRLSGLHDVRLYDLRHTFASAGLDAGLSLEVIGQLLGHRRAQSTKRYAHLMRDTGRESVLRVSAALGRL